MDKDILKQIENLTNVMEQLKQVSNETLNKVAEHDVELYEDLAKDFKQVTESNDISKILEIHRKYAGRNTK